ncbi:P-loop containing nucleoside triphosphate hydrolase protein [Umbelopsis sp. PMI_123]|nr:P-loop containing nucleoside triphosphate hydrolase protein [Umbelopsis sp. PMI_123]
MSGLEKAYDALLEVVSYPLLYNDVIETLNIECPKGVLLYGPPGVGKTHLVSSIAKVCGAEMDALTPNRQNAQSHESRVVAQLLTLMDGMENRGRTVVIGATNRPNALDPALRRPGRFDREILIDAPNENARLHILQSQLKKVPIVNEDDVLAKLALMTNGYVAADLMALCREATMVAIERCLENQDDSKRRNSDLYVTIDDFAASMAKVGPSIQRGYETVVEKKGWDDIGGLEDVKKKLKQATEWPLLHKETFKRLGLKPPRGILLFGPPGCSKTTLVKVIASVSGATFLSINGAQIYSPFVGDSEKIIRTTFQKARSAAPSVIFLDEIEAIVGKRNLGTGGSGSDAVQERVLSTLLNEMDGVELASSVLVIGATNRPDMLDAALMRPGRFDKIIYVPPPDFVSRQQILQVHTQNIPLADDVDLEEIADKTNLYTGADLQNLCREAAMIALRQNRSACTVAQQNLEAALKIVKPSLTFKVLKQYEALQNV